MMLKRSTRQSQPKPSASSPLVRAGLAAAGAVTLVAGLATGCLDRKVVPAKPTTSNVFVSQIVQTSVDKIDLLFMIDNSVSMADKQDILRDAVPVLLGRLVAPICIDGSGNPTGETSSAGLCAKPNTSAEFAPINDIHIGIVSSSLGAHGGNAVCNGMETGIDPTLVHDDDHGHLIGTVRTGVTTWNNSGFLAWDPNGKDLPVVGEKNAATLNTAFANMVTSVGEHGCGYEASLEAWYRFLIDPEPPATVAKVGNFTVRQGMDTTLLAQRAAFLRPDSLVAIVMLTDENDCSILDSNVGWFVGSQSPMPKAAQPCAADPNDKCCRSCAQNEPMGPPAGCTALTDDPVCKGAPAKSYNTWTAPNDALNLRCYNQKQRFGFDLLYPTARYVQGLTSPSLVLQSDGKTVVTNPLYDPGSSGKPPRDPSLVFLAGIIGVPWQDISDAASLASPTALNYLTAADLVAQGRWPQLLGTPDADPPVPPSDPFMVETPQPRTGRNPNVAVSIASADSTNPIANGINGHEQHIPMLDDLQYACTFQLGKPKVCAMGDSACDCSADVNGDTKGIVAANSPLCQPPGGGAPGTTQYYAKAYPGARELQVLKDFGNNAIVASICPKVPASANPATDPNYGYNPAVAAIISRLKEALKGKCLPRKLAKVPGADGAPTNQVECQVIEAQKAGQCDCSVGGRQPADPAIFPAIARQLQALNTCGGTNQPPCTEAGFCICEVRQEQGQALLDCQANSMAVATPGYCYIDDPASPALKDCPDNQKQLLRFVDDGSGMNKVPAQGATAFIACLGADINGP
jgi:hypothetical protein